LHWMDNGKLMKSTDLSIGQKPCWTQLHTTF